MSAPITENVYIMVMELLSKSSLEDVRQQLHKEVDLICDGIEYGEEDDPQ